MDILSRGKYSMVFKSKQCDCINITLPNVNIHLDTMGLGQFMDQVEETFIFLANPHETSKVYCLDTPYNGITLHFNLNEIRDLLDTLLDAKLQIELDFMIN